MATATKKFDPALKESGTVRKIPGYYQIGDTLLQELKTGKDLAWCYAYLANWHNSQNRYSRTPVQPLTNADVVTIMQRVREDLKSYIGELEKRTWVPEYTIKLYGLGGEDSRCRTLNAKGDGYDPYSYEVRLYLDLFNMGQLPALTRIDVEMNGDLIERFFPGKGKVSRYIGWDGDVQWSAEMVVPGRTWGERVGDWNDWFKTPELAEAALMQAIAPEE